MKYSKELKSEILSFSENNGLKQACEKYTVSRGTVYRWRTENNTDRSDKKLLCDLQSKYNTLMKELEIIKKLNCSLNSPLAVKYKDMDKLVPEYGVHAVCRALNVSRSTYYNHALRSPEITEIEKEDATLRPVVKEVFDEVRGRVGSKKIRILMMKRGYTISAVRVARLMQEQNLVCNIERKEKPEPCSPPRYPNKKDLVKRRFNQKAPNIVWVSDFTELYAEYKRFYLFTVMDLFSRKIIAFRLSERKDTSQTSAVFRDAFRKRNNPKWVIFHSDQGSQYTDQKFCAMLQKNKVLQSFSLPGTPLDNAVAESFFKSLKAEETSCYYYTTERQLRRSVNDYIQFYNKIRPHESLDYDTPDEVEEKYYRNIAYTQTMLDRMIPVF